MKKAKGRAERRQDEPAQQPADDPGGVHVQEVEDRRARDRRRRDEVVDDGHRRRRADRLGHTEQDGQPQQDDELGVAAEGDRADDDSDDSQCDEVRHEHRPRAETVGQNARLRHQQQERDTGDRVDQADGGRRAGQLQRVPAERGIEQEDPAGRAQHRRDEEAERGVFERGPADAIESRVGPAHDLGGRSGHEDHCKSHWMLGAELQCYASS